MKKTKKRLSFAHQLFLGLVGLFMLGLIAIYSYLWETMQDQLYFQLGQKALVQAKEIAVIPSIIQATENNDQAKLKAIISKIEAQSDASFIVIGDRKTIRLYHTEQDKINSRMQGNDNLSVLNGESILSLSTGSLGLSLRGKAPILNQQHQVIGIVSVGYLQNMIDKRHLIQFVPIAFFGGFMVLLIFVFSWLFSAMIKKQMLNLEPREIAFLVHKQTAILESIVEGIIVIDRNYHIILINRAARELLEINDQYPLNKPLFDLIAPIDFLTDPINETQDVQDEICYFNHKTVIASRIRILFQNESLGWVISFRDKNEINDLSLQLSQVRQSVDNLRIIRHEHLNIMATLAGMLQLNHYEDALRFIQAQSNKHQTCLDFLSAHCLVPAVCGLLIGKYSKANELGIELIFDPLSQLNTLPDFMDETEFISIVGNLIDNACNAVIAQRAFIKRMNPSQTIDSTVNQIECYFSDAMNDIVIEVADQGIGIDPNIRETLFQRGITTQTKGDHGIGLHLVSTYVQKYHGYIEVNDNEPNGTVFSVFMPRQIPYSHPLTRSLNG